MRVNFDVLMILDALDRHGSFATAAESLYKTPAALSYMIQKLESDLNIVLLDRSGHRAKFTDTGPADAGEGATAFKCRQRSGKAGPAAERGLGARASHRP
ncbi:transcriptional regulator yeeY [Klebsiella pneumoniae]|uniref:Transcriptional regulator yeeY n=1 Tax=Klebsiella pneumoniae TaxID=573 RepID=A0A377WE94_KLEPN|nr:transcriptional regulator yeeY [Klebsiella pneumoniae]